MTAEIEPIWCQLVWNAEIEKQEKVESTTGVIVKRIRESCKDYSINLLLADGFSNVVHLIFYMKPTLGINQVVSQIKLDTAAFLREEKLSPEGFYWYKGHRSFSIDSDQVEKVKTFIDNQKVASKGIKYNLPQK